MKRLISLDTEIYISTLCTENRRLMNKLNRKASTSFEFLSTWKINDQLPKELQNDDNICFKFCYDYFDTKYDVFCIQYDWEKPK